MQQEIAGEVGPELIEMPFGGELASHLVVPSERFAGRLADHTGAGARGARLRATSAVSSLAESVLDQQGIGRRQQQVQPGHAVVSGLQLDSAFGTRFLMPRGDRVGLDALHEPARCASESGRVVSAGELGQPVVEGGDRVGLVGERRVRR